MIWFDDLYTVLEKRPYRLDSPSITGLSCRDDISRYIARCIAARATRINLFTNHIRTVAEWIVAFEFEGRSVSLPVAAVGDGDWLRIYHSMMPIIGKHRNRPALLDADYHAPLNGTFYKYFRDLDLGNVDALVDTFNENGYFRAAASNSPKYRGKDALRSMYGKMLAQGGSPLELATATIARGHGAFEYNFLPWCREDICPQAGLMLITEGQRSIASIHAYNDVPLSPYHNFDGTISKVNRALC